MNEADNEQAQDTSPLVSIIIATYNAGAQVDRTLQSLLAQTCRDFEVLVIDGASTDNTHSYLNKYQFAIKRLVSEPDSGVYDAWNKGIKLARGQWIAFLGAGDEYLPEAIGTYKNYLQSAGNPDLDLISSQVKLVRESGQELYRQGKPWSWPAFLSSMTCAHVGAWHAAGYFVRYGLFDSTYRIAGDYELLMRAQENLRAAYLPVVTVNMLSGGISQSSEVIIEDRRLKIQTGHKPVWKANIEFFVKYLKTTLRYNLLNITHEIKKK
jgi:glycosyltransferase involved in cell wall biosynthesis